MSASYLVGVFGKSFLLIVMGFRLKYTWSSKEIEEAERATVLLAADVIYCDKITDVFFANLVKLMSCGSEKVTGKKYLLQSIKFYMNPKIL